MNAQKLIDKWWRLVQHCTNPKDLEFYARQLEELGATDYATQAFNKKKHFDDEQTRVN